MSKAPLPWLLATLVLALSACARTAPPPALPPVSGPATQPAPVQPMPAAGPVTLALLVPRTAQAEGAARLAEALSDAARLALEDLRDPEIALRVYDTRGDAAGAAQAAQAAVAEGADLILGPLFAASTQAAAEVAGPAGIGVISFSSDSTVAGGPVHVSGYTPESEARRILAHAAAQGFREVAVFYPATDFGAAVMRGVRGAEATGRVRLVAAQGYERSFKGIETASESFAPQALGFGAQAVLLPAGGRELQAVASFLNYHQVDPQRVRYLGLGQWDSRASFEEPSLRGGWFVAPDPGLMADFAARFRGRFGSQPPVLATLGYDAVAMAGEMVRTARAERRAPFAPADFTRPQGFRGVLGPVRFLPDGTAEHGMAILEVGERDFLVIDPAPFAFGAGS